MEAADILLTYAEVSVALAGFIGIAAAFRRGDDDWARHDIGSVRFVLEVSFTALFASVLPGVFASFGVDPAHAWRGAAVLLGVWLVAMYGLQTRRRRRLDALDALRAPIPGRAYYLAAYLLISVGVIVAGVVDLYVRGAYLVGIGMLLVAAAIEFLSFAASLQPQAGEAGDRRARADADPNANPDDDAP